MEELRVMKPDADEEDDALLPALEMQTIRASRLQDEHTMARSPNGYQSLSPRDVDEHTVGLCSSTADLNQAQLVRIRSPSELDKANSARTYEQMMINTIEAGDELEVLTYTAVHVIRLYQCSCTTIHDSRCTPRGGFKIGINRTQWCPCACSTQIVTQLVTRTYSYCAAMRV